MEPFLPQKGLSGKKPALPRLLFLQEPPRAGFSGGQKIHHRFAKEAAKFAEVIYPEAAVLTPPSGNLWRRVAGRWQHARNLAASLAGQKPDAIFMDLYWFRSYGPALLQVSRQIPLILYVQTAEALVKGDATEQQFAPWFYPRNPARRWWYGHLAKKLFQRAWRVLALGPWLTRFLNGMGCAADKMIITGSGIEFPATAGLDPGPADSAPRWMASGYVDPYKGTHHLIEALALLPLADRPVIDWYGQTEHNPPYFSWCQSLMKSLGVQANIRFHGWVDHEQMQEAWKSHDIFVSAAPHEGYGLVFCEALAQGVFLVGPRGSSMEDFVTRPETGFCFDATDPSNLAGAMVHASVMAAQSSREARRLAASGTLAHHLAKPSPAEALRMALNW